MSPEQQPQPENNIAINGDEARILMVALLQTTVRAPVATAIGLYTKLAEISYAQPQQVKPNGPQSNL